jgi:glycogen debranching enzyme
LRISKDAKKKIYDEITKRRDFLVTLSSEKKTMPMNQPNPVSINPEIARIISTNFSAYMAKMKERFGRDGLIAMRQALENEINKQ